MELRYEGHYGLESVCEIEVYKSPETQKSLAIASEVSWNNGTSITHRTHHIATKICKQFNLNPYTFTYIEHQPKDNNQTETLNQLRFTILIKQMELTFNSPRKTPITWKAIDTLRQPMEKLTPR